MLANNRTIKFTENSSYETPLLIPSFSSKGFTNLNEIIDFSKDFITESSLVSAYDVFYQHINPSINFPEILVLDSGGYEASKEQEFSDFGYTIHEPKIWNEYFYSTVLSNWNTTSNTIYVSYDHPNIRTTITDQVERAFSLFPDNAKGAKTLLLKPESFQMRYLDLDSLIDKSELITQFDIIGLTEKEIGCTVLDRMIFIAKLRKHLHGINSHIPIHIFGSLDTVTTMLYFISGADIFDGLNWLRYKFNNGETSYTHSSYPLVYGIEDDSDIVLGRSWADNVYYLDDLKKQMNKYINTSSFASFKHHEEFFSSSYSLLKERMGE